jgi:peptide/nickel transport system permease protein
MLRFVVMRLLRAVSVLIVTSVVTFAMFFALPADPALALCGKSCDTVKYERVKHTLGLDEPLVNQYADYMKGIFVGRDLSAIAGGKFCDAPCLGYSFEQGELVTDALKRTYPITLSLIIPAFILYLLFGIGLGVLAALKRGRAMDRFAVGLSLIGASSQIFTIGFLLVYIFLVTLKISPPPSYTPLTENPLKWASGLWMGWVALGFISMAIHTRLSRAQMLETLSEDFVRTARAKGLPLARVYGKHALRAALTPMVTQGGLEIGTLLGGAVITETTTSVNGVGSLAVAAARSGDLAVVMATVLISAVFVVAFVIIVDVLYAVIDPRVKLG